MMTNVERHPYVVPNHAINGGATMAPIAAPLLNIPVAVDRSSAGNHSPVSFMAAGQLPASPITKQCPKYSEMKWQGCQ